MASNTNFLDWLKKYPYKTRIISYNKDMSRLRKAFFWLLLKPMFKLLSYKYDVIFCDWFDELASIMSKVSSKSIFIRLHRSEVYGSKFLKESKLGNIKCIITVSNYYKNIVSNLYDENIPICVVPNGIDTTKYSFNPRINRPLKLCTLSNLIPRKRIFDLIVNNPDLAINIGGDGIERMILENAIDRFSLKAKLHGFVELPDFYHKHDIFIINSSDESFGVSIIEAMSCGLIPLSFSRPEAEEILPKEYLYRDYDEMRKKIAQLMDKTDEELMKIKQEMRSIVESKFSLECQVTQFLSLFSQY